MNSDSEFESDEEFELDAVDTEYQEDFKNFATSELGLSLESAHADLAWVAWEAFTRPPPEGWSEHTDPSGRVYYHNWATRESMWSHPDDAMFKDLLDIIKGLRAERPFASEARRNQVMQDHLNKVYKVAERDLQDWSGPYSKEGGESKEGGDEYFFNEKLKESVWENPTERWERQLATCQAVLHRCLLIDWPHPSETLSKDLSAAQVRSLAQASDALKPSRPPKDDDELSAESAKSNQTMHTCRSFRTARSERSARSGRSPRNARSGSQTPRGKRSAEKPDVPSPLPPAALPARLNSQSEFLPRFGAAEDSSPLKLAAAEKPFSGQTKLQDSVDIESLLPELPKIEVVDNEKVQALHSEEKTVVEEKADATESRLAREEAEVVLSSNKKAADATDLGSPTSRKATAEFGGCLGSPTKRKTTSEDIDLGSPQAVAVPALDLRLKNALDAFMHNSHLTLELETFVNPDQRPRAWSAVEKYPGLKCEVVEGRLKVFKDDSQPCDISIKGDVVDSADIAGGLAAEKIVVDSDLIKKCAEDETSDISTISQLSSRKKAPEDTHGSPARHPFSSPTGSSRSSNNVQFFNIYDVEAVDDDGNEVDKVRQWLKKLGLGRYFEQLEMQGFDNMHILANLNEDQLKVLMEMVPMPYLHEQQLRRGLAQLNADVQCEDNKVSAA